MIKAKASRPRKLWLHYIPPLPALCISKAIFAKQTQLSPFPPELTEMIWSEYHHYFLDRAAEHSIIGAYLIRGGISCHRRQKAWELIADEPPNVCLVWISPGALEYGVCLYRNSMDFYKLSMDVDAFRQLVQAGDYLKNPQFKTINLRDPLREDMTPFLLSGHDVTIRITAEAVTFPFQLRDEAKDSIIYILEHNSAQNLVISWNSTITDIRQLPALPRTLKTLTIRQVEPFPDGIPPGQYHELGWKLSDLKVLRFENCTIEKQVVEDLQRWLPYTKLKVVNCL